MTRGSRKSDRRGCTVLIIIITTRDSIALWILYEYAHRDKSKGATHECTHECAPCLMAIQKPLPLACQSLQLGHKGERERKELRRAVIVFIFIFLVFVVVVVIYVFISYFFLCLLSLFSFFPLLFYFEWVLRKLHQGELFTFPLCPLPFSFFTLPSSAFAVAPNLRIPSTFELRSDCAAAAPRYNLSARLAGLALPTHIAQLKGIGKGA